jgi:hypothetical protein
MDCLITGEIRESTETILREISAAGIFENKVLSTWKGAKHKIKIPTDWIIIECDDPGTLVDVDQKSVNILRSATLRYYGIRQTSGSYLYKGRTDIGLRDGAYKRLSNYTDNEILRSRLLFDTVGTTKEFLHFSDFCLAGEHETLKKAFNRLYARLKNTYLREHLINLITTSSSHSFHSKRYDFKCPAETMNFVFSFYSDELEQCKSLPQLEYNLARTIQKIDFFSVRDFYRGPKLDPRSGIKPLYRYVRGKIPVGSTVGNLIDRFY